MGNNLNNNYVKNLYNQLLSNNQIEDLTQQDLTVQKSKLSQLFSYVSDNNATKEDSEYLSSELAKIQQKVVDLEEKMQELADVISNNDDKISQCARKIEECVTNISNESNSIQDNYETEAKAAAQSGLKEAISEYKKHHNDSGSNSSKYTTANFPNLISEKIKEKLGSINIDTSALDKYLTQLESHESVVEDYSNQISDMLNTNELYKSQYSTYNTICTMLDKNIKQIASTGTNYVNSDYDTARPIYSSNQVDIITELSTNFSTNAEKVQGTTFKTTEEKLDAITSKNGKYANYLNVAATGDIYTMDNNAIKALNNAVNAGLLTDLQNVGLSQAEMAGFFGKYFSGAGFKYNEETGVLDYNYGHDTTSQTLFKTVTQAILSSESDNYAIYYNEDNVNNTISNNAQIAMLANNYSDILSTLSKNNFTFKEAMYVLFDSESGIFKNAGINYNLSDQKSDNANYSITQAGDENTAKVYKDIAALIYKYWGVKSDNELNNKDVIPNGNETEVETDVHDPLTFSKNGKEYSLVIDKDNDGVFDINTTSNESEFVGGSKSSNWLQDLISLAGDDGIISDSELDNVKLFGISVDNELSSKSREGFNDTDTGNISYEFVTASNLGVSEINLTQFAKKDEDGNILKNEDGSIIWDEDKINASINKATEIDVNGNTLFEDSVEIKFSDGSTETATRKDDTLSYIKAFYSAADKKSFTVGGHSVEEIEEIFDSYDAEERLKEFGIDDDSLLALKQAKTIFDNYDYMLSASKQEVKTTEESIGIDSATAKKLLYLAMAQGKAEAIDEDETASVNYNYNNTETEKELEVKAMENGINVSENYIEDEEDVLFSESINGTNTQIKEILNGLYYKTSDIDEAIAAYKENTDYTNADLVLLQNTNEVILKLSKELIKASDYADVINSLLRSGVSVASVVEQIKAKNTQE